MNFSYQPASRQAVVKDFYKIRQGLLCVIMLLLISSNVSAQNLTQAGFVSVLTPQYIGSGTSTRLPIMYRATVTGLTANTSYRYFTQMALATDFGTTNPGAGNPLMVSEDGLTYLYSTGASISTAGNYSTFTTDSAGNYTGWFGVVNTGNARFTAGNILFPTIVIGNSSGTTLFRRALDVSVKVLGYAVTAGANNGSFLKQNSSGATGKNIAVLYDNISGSGRPVFMAPIEPIGVTIASVIAGYTTGAGGWNTIIPNDGINGIRRIEQRSVTNASLVGCANDEDGTWATGSIVTSYPSNGTSPLIIDPADAPLSSCFVCPSINVSASAGTISCPGGTAQVLISATGGTAPYNGTGIFNVGAGSNSFLVTDANGCTGSVTITVSNSTDTVKPGLALGSSKFLTGIKGNSSSQTPYLLPSRPGPRFTSILTVGDTVGSTYRMVGIPDGLGAYDNNDGTFTLLMNHELGNTVGINRAHGAKGAFVSKWVINKSNLSVVSGSDLIQQVYLWDTATQAFVQNPSVAFSRFCSADLPAISAFYNSASGLGTTERIFMNGEESGAEGRAFGHIATGINAGKTYELPYLGKFSWENSVASPASGNKTVVVGLDDATGGQVYVYVGNKTAAGNEIEKAGLHNGKLYGVKVVGFTAESNASIPAAGTRFELFDFANVRNKTGAALNSESVTAGVTAFLRPEDGAWDPRNPNDFYFVTTNGFNSPTRLWRLRFDNILSPETGGTIEAVLTGTEPGGPQMFDNMSIDRYGKILIQEDPGNQEYIARIWQYDIAADSAMPIAYHDSTRFTTGAVRFLTRDEESSGIIDMSEILGPGMYLLDVQAHYGIAGELVEGGQLLALYNPLVFGNASAPDTIRTFTNSGCSVSGLNLGVPAAADNCGIGGIANNAPSSFPLGTTIVNWTANDINGNSSSIQQVVIVADSSKPVIVPPAAITVATNDGCGASGINLSMPVVSDNCGVIASINNNAPAVFPLGTTIVTWTVADTSGNTSTATQSVTVIDTLKPVVYLQASNISLGVKGISSSQTPYLLPSKKGLKFTSILTVGDTVGSTYRMVGIPDGLGAYDNNDGTFTLLMNHELGNTVGINRAHGAKGAFVSKWVINKSNLSVVSGSDLIQQVYLWDTATQAFVQNPAVAFSRFCSADLPALSAFYNTTSGLGTTERIFMNGEESGAEGRAFGHIATGINAGKTYELPYLGKFSWENSVASPASGNKTVVVGLDDATGGQVYVYIGNKTKTGSEIEKAGLHNGKLYGVKVVGFTAESNGSIPAAGTRFELFDFGNVRNKTGAALNSESVTAGVTAFLRPEDGAWDPRNPNDFYFVTTNGFNSPTRLWRLRFDNILSPETGGTIEAVLPGAVSGEQMFDNMSIDRYGKILIQEDPGNQEYIARIWQYDIAADSAMPIAYHDSTRFTTGAVRFLTRDEESSGIIDMSEILGPGMYLLDVQAHYGIAGELVEGGQLLALYNPLVFGNSTAPDTIRVLIDSGSVANVNLGIPTAADNCSISSLSNNAPSSFPVGTTIVTWTATDGSGNNGTAQQVVIVGVRPNKKPVVSITKPFNGANFTVGVPIALEAAASDSDGVVSYVAFYDKGVEFFRDSSAPYQYTGINIPAGLYVVTAKAFDNRGDSAVSDTVRVTVTECQGSGSILGEGYTNIPGNRLVDLASSIKYPNNPDVSVQLNKFEYGPNIDDNYGARVRGYICAPVTGDYIFYISSDNQSELWLSTDDSPLNIRRIAYVESQTGFRSYFGNLTQRSVAIRLIAGARYYIETVHKEGTGNDHLSVAWRLPNGVVEGPIPGSRLSPWAGAPIVQGGARKTFEEEMRLVVQGWSVKVSPNPSVNRFVVTTRSNSEERITISIVDVLGRVTERRTGLAANGTIELGQQLKAGVYFIEVSQGSRKERIKVVKQ